MKSLAKFITLKNSSFTIVQKLNKCTLIKLKLEKVLLNLSKTFKFSKSSNFNISITFHFQLKFILTTCRNRFNCFHTLLTSVIFCIIIGGITPYPKTRASVIKTAPTTGPIKIHFDIFFFVSKNLF
jgi:hypothetical protein